MNEKKYKYLHLILFLISLIVVGFCIYAYISYKLYNNQFYENLLNFNNSDGIFWILIIFVILCNIPYLRGIIISVVKDKINSETIEATKQYVVEEIKKNPDYFEEVYEKAQKNKENQSINVNETKDQNIKLNDNK